MKEFIENKTNNNLKFPIKKIKIHSKIKNLINSSNNDEDKNNKNNCNKKINFNIIKKKNFNLPSKNNVNAKVINIKIINF